MRDLSARRAVQLAIAVAAVALTIIPAAAPAAPAAQPTREQLNVAGQTDRAARHRAGDLFSAPVFEKCTLPDDPALKFKLNDVAVEGAASLSDKATRASFTDLVGTEITPAALCEIRDRIAASLFHRGILARVLIPQQKITDGRVVITVIEAQIVSVRVHGDVGPAQAQVEAYLNHLRGLAPFDLNTAQRFLLLANDVPGVRANARLVHSSAPGVPAGALDLDVLIERTPYDAVGAVQNTSSKVLGPWSGVARVDFNSFTPFGERTTLIGYTTLGNNSQQVVELMENARIGASGLYAQGSIAYGLSHPGDVLKPLHLKGDSVVATAEIEDPVIRLKRANLTLGAGFDYIDQKTDFPGGGELTNDKLRIAWLRADGNAQHAFDPRGYPGLTGVDGGLTIDLRKGLDGLGASPAGAIALSRPAGRSDAFVVRADGQAALHAALAERLPLTLSVHVQAQWADKPLLAYEEQAIGNLTIGQGYDPAAASGDRVVAAEFKAAFGPFDLAEHTALRPYVFYDTAHINNLDPGSQDVNVRSVGVGAELRLPYHIRADIDFAQPLDRPVPSAAVIPPSRVLFRLVVAY